MKKITCHQYATGRGPSGYGFVAFSRTDPKRPEPSYTFSPNKAMGLRFSQLPAGADYVFEVEPASADYRHAGAFLTRNREDGGSSSVYTHALIPRERPEGAEALGLLRIENFLTPDEFTEVTRSARQLEIVEKDCTFSDTRYAPLNENQKGRLGEFLARYWALLEQREWSGKGTSGLALLLSGMGQAETIAFFAKEVVPCLPEYVRPAISVSFGATWNNRGSSPAVCCVLPNNSESPFPCYDPGEDAQKNFARPAGPVEERIGRLLIQRDHNLYPEVYRRIETFAKEDDACSNMARAFSVMAYGIQAEMAREAGSAQDMMKALDALAALAGQRYGIKKDRIPDLFLPIIQDVFDLINRKSSHSTDDVMWMMRQNIALHRSEAQKREPESLKKNDESLMQSFNDLNLDQMKETLSNLWQELKQESLSSGEIYLLLQQAEQSLLRVHTEAGSDKLVQSALDQYVRLDREAGDEARELTDQYRNWLGKEENSSELLKVLSSSDALLAQNEGLYFSLLEKMKDQMGNMNEATIVNFLKTAKRAGGKNQQRAEVLIRDAHQSIMNGISRLRGVSTDGFRIVSEAILAQKPTKETAGKIIDFALQNAQCSEAAPFLKQAVETMVVSDASDDPEYQKILFEKLEQASEAGSQFSMEDAVRKLLEKTNNKVLSDRTLGFCEKISQARLDKCMEQFFQNTEIGSDEEPGKIWNRLFAEKYSTQWEELESTRMAEPIAKRFETQYGESDDQLGLLIGAWDQALQSNHSSYSSALQNAVVSKLEKVYDSLWQGGDAEARKELDDLIQKCAETEYGNGLAKKRDETTAGKARAFLGELRSLSRSGMDRAPEKAGELICRMRNEKGFNQCIRVDGLMDHRPDDRLYDLVISLLQSLLVHTDDSGYWEEPLARLGFDVSLPVWNGDGLRMLNILSYVLYSLDEMKVTGMGEDLREYLGDKYMGQLWEESKADGKWFHNCGRTVLSGPLYQWLSK